MEEGQPKNEALFPQDQGPSVLIPCPVSAETGKQCLKKALTG